MARIKRVVAASVGIGLAVTSPSGARQEGAADARERALAALDPLIGRWEGEGFVRNGPGDPETRTGTRWTVEHGFEGRFVRMEFALLRDDGTVRGEWVGYFTFDGTDGLYHSTWTLVTSGRDFTFHETGAFDAQTKSLRLESHQRRAGADGPVTKVDSVFTFTGAESFVVEDTTHDPASGEAFVSLRYELRRIGR